MSDPKDFTVGWICALPTEQVAARAMLDEELPRIESRRGKDSNAYLLGRIGQHAVTIAVLPHRQPGISSATGALKDMINTFSNLRFVLMVGIGGGAPTSSHPIRLGDVVVSTVTGEYGGVIQYDLGKTIQSQQFQRTGYLGSPPIAIQAAVSSLIQSHEFEGHRIQENIGVALGKNKRLQKKYAKPPIETDRLFETAALHPQDSDGLCAFTCDETQTVSRPSRAVHEDDPQINYGLIASANNLMKDALMRDRLAKEKGILCFEMEAAGLMNHFPCLVIRGICDYSDSHKNQEWQGYAAMTAAAYAKELLGLVTPEQVQETQKLADLIERVRYEIQEIRSLQKDQSQVLASVNQKADAQKQDWEIAKLPTVPDATHNAYNEGFNARCLPNTRVELRRKIQEWAAATDSKSVYWLNGIAGTGKSTIARTVAQDLSRQHMLGASFFFKRGAGDRSRAVRLFPSIASQLVRLYDPLKESVVEALRADPDVAYKSLKEQFERLILQPLSTLKAVSGHSQRLVLVIDALDECDQESDIRTIISLFTLAGDNLSAVLRVFVTSRPELPIRLGFGELSTSLFDDFILHKISASTVEHDIKLFLEHEFHAIRSDYDLTTNWPGKSVITQLAQLAVPLFIFAATICRFVRDSTRPPEQQLKYILESALENKASGMDITYLPILNQLIDKKNLQEKNWILREFSEIVGSIILLASPLSAIALAHLIGVDERNVAHLLQRLHSVLEVPLQKTDPIRPFHLSFRDFLIGSQEGIEKESPFQIDEKKGHSVLARRCLKLLSSSPCLKQDICNKGRPGMRKNDISQTEVEQAVPAEIRYACRYWVYHAKRYSLADEDISLIYSFMQSHFLFWLEALSLINCAKESIEMMTTLQTIPQVVACSGLDALVNEAKRFTRHNFSIIEEFPLQLYASALVFTPADSTVRKLFKRFIPRQIIQLPKIEEHRSSYVQTLTGNLDQIHALTFSPDSRILASRSADKTIRLWDIATGTTNTILEPYPEVHGMAFSPDSQILIFKHASGTASLWDVATGTMRTLEGAPIYFQAAFSPDHQILAYRCSDKTVKLWDSNTQTVRGMLESSLNDFPELISPDGQTLASVYHKIIRLWDVATGTVCNVSDCFGRVYSLKFSPSSQILVSCHFDAIRQWNVATGTIRRVYKSGRHFRDLTFSPNGRTLKFISNVTTRLWDMATGTIHDIDIGPDAWILTAEFSPNSQMLHIVSSDRTIQRWDAITGSLRSKVALEDNLAWSPRMTFLPDGQGLISRSQYAVRLVDADTGAVRKSLGHSAPSREGALSPDGQMLAFGSDDGTIRLWSITIGTVGSSSEGHSDWVRVVAFSSNGQTLASGSDDKKVRLWDTATGNLLRVLQGHSGWVFAVAFSPDSRTLASGSADHTGRLWDVAAGMTSAILDDHTGWIQSVVFSPDGQTLASGSTDNTIKLWDVATRHLKYSLRTGASVFELSFTDDGLGLQTNIGLFQSHCPPQLTSASTTPNERSPISIKTPWIAYGGEDIIWLPLEYHPDCIVIQGPRLAMGHKSGHVTMIGFSSYPNDA